jgi:hypothetical protein
MHFSAKSAFLRERILRPSLSRLSTPGIQVSGFARKLLVHQAVAMLLCATLKVVSALFFRGIDIPVSEVVLFPHPAFSAI